MTRHALAELMGKKPRRDEEEKLQRAVMEHIKWRKMPNVVAFHVPNGEARSKATGGRLKAMGVRAGVFDLILFVPSPEGPQTYLLELKAGSNRMSEAQEAFAAELDELGIGWSCAWTLDDALAYLEAIGAIRPSSQDL